MANGFFISFEGVEGAGKSTQARLLAAALQADGREVLLTREPGGTPVSEELRRIVKHTPGDTPLCAEAELLIMAASRAQLMRQVIIPFLAHGGVVVCDRFADSTTVYQGYARGLDLGVIAQVNALATGGRWPDLTLVLDLPVDAGFSRVHQRTDTNAAAIHDRFEAEAREFHEKVRAGFQALAHQEPARLCLLSAAAAVDALQARIRALVAERLRY